MMNNCCNWLLILTYILVQVRTQ